MSVIKFPGRRKTTTGPDTTPHERGDTPYREDYGQEAPYFSEAEPGYGDYGAERPYPPHPAPSRPKSRKTLSPAEAIAQSLNPAGFRGGRQQPPRSPAEIIAQSLNPPGFAPAEELLRHSFWQVWLQHHDYLRKKSLHLLDSHREDAEDVLSTTMLKALHHFVESAGEVANTQAWLTTILHNACIDGHRSAKRRRDLFMEAEAEEYENLPPEPGGRAQSPEDIVRIRQSLEDLYRSILELPAGLREPLLLRTVEHLSYAEIARQLGLTEANTRKRVQQARDQLRGGRLRDSLGDHPDDY